MTLRARKQEAARDHVAEAAAPLFIADGYTGTTTRAVAEAAGVAEGTIFNLFGTKAGLLLAALRVALPEPSEAQVWIDWARDEVTPQDVVGRFVRTGMEVAARAIPLVRVFLEAAAVDDVVAEAWRAQEEARRQDQAGLLRALEDRGWLRGDRAFDDLSRDLWILAAPETHVKFLDAGLDEAAFQDWQRGALCALLIDPEARA